MKNLAHPDWGVTKQALGGLEFNKLQSSVPHVQAGDVGCYSKSMEAVGATIVHEPMLHNISIRYQAALIYIPVYCVNSKVFKKSVCYISWIYNEAQSPIQGRRTFPSRLLERDNSDGRAGITPEMMTHYSV